MKKNVIKFLSLGLSVVLMVSCVGSAAAAMNRKDTQEVPETTDWIPGISSTDVAQSITNGETVYVIADADGGVQKVLVSSNGEEAKETTKDLPIELKVSYQLDGNAIKAEDLDGKNGKLTMRFDYTNNRYEEKKIDGKTEKIYVPFVMMTGLLLNNDAFSNIEVTNGKLMDDGDRTAVLGIAFPGLQEDLAIDKEKYEIPSYVEVTADVVDYESKMTVSIATNDVFNKLDTNQLDNVDDLESSMSELTSGMNELLDGSSQLYDGLNKLLTKSADLTSGIDQLATGSATLATGTANLDAGVAKLQTGAQQLNKGLNTLSSKNGELNAGAKQVFDSLLQTANTQIKNAGLELPTLTVDNYAAVLTAAIASMDSTAVYEQALAEVTGQVEAKREQIQAKVTAEIRKGVEEEVTQTVSEMFGGDVSSEAAQQAIEEQVEEIMNSEATQETILKNTDDAVQSAIAEAMEGEAVQKKLAAADAGAQSLIGLKTSLDSYNAFYTGLQSYTNGVADASKGAKDLKKGTDDLRSGSEQLNSGANTLKSGIATLQSNVPALTDGITQLRDGSMQLSEGLQQFNDEGISKLTGAFEGDVEGLVHRLRATAEVSKNYKSFDKNATANGEGVKFIFKTE